MKFCAKCHQKTELRSGRVQVKIGDTFIETDAPVYHCRKCDMNWAALEVKVLPMPGVLENSNIGNAVKEGMFNA